MSNITLPRATVEQVLETIEGLTSDRLFTAEWAGKHGATIAALRAALAQQDEPVARSLTEDERAAIEYFALNPSMAVLAFSHWLRRDKSAPLQRLAEPVQEPVAWMLPGSDSIITAETKAYRGMLAENWTLPLYAAPPRCPNCAALAQQDEPEAYGYASRLAVAIWEKHYKDTAPDWKPLDDLVGVLTQIDNMTSGLTLLAQQAEPVQEPVAWNGMLDGLPYGQACYGRPPDADIVETLRLREDRAVRLLYTAPPQRKQAEPLNLSDPAVQKRLATQWGYVPAAQAEPVEPVAKVELMMTGGNAGLATRIVEIEDHLRERLRPGQQLYIAPPQRLPLTEEEIESCRQQGYAHAGLGAPFDFGKAARAVERAVWEKNHG